MYYVRARVSIIPSSPPLPSVERARSAVRLTVVPFIKKKIIIITIYYYYHDNTYAAASIRYSTFLLLFCSQSDAGDGRQDRRCIDRLVDPHVFCKYL